MAEGIIGVKLDMAKALLKTSPAQFVRQVRQEIKKVSWPARKEVVIGTVMVFILATIMSVFFLFVDQLLSWLVKLILG